MKIAVDAATLDTGRWITARANGRPEIGAHIQENSGQGVALITVFWCGIVNAHHVRDAIQYADKLDAVGPSVKTTITSFGSEKTVVQSRGRDELTDYLHDRFPLSKFEAYRAEFHGQHGDVIFWANVEPSERGKLEQGEENVGIAVTPSLFEGLSPTLIARTIQQTSGIDSMIVDDLLQGIKTSLKATSLV